MSRVLTAKEVCERALRDIGAFPISDSAADGEDLREAMYRLDLILSEVSGTADWLIHQVPDPIPLTLEAGQQEYVLSSEMGSGTYPTNGIQFVREAWIETAAGNRSKIDIVSKSQFENVADPDRTGVPQWVYIDKDVTPSPTLKTFPTLHADETETYTVYLLCETFAPNVSPGGVSGTKPDGQTAHSFRPAWQRWLIYRLAADCGRGAIRRLPQGSINDYDQQAERAYRLLAAYENRENDDSAPIAEPNEPYEREEVHVTVPRTYS